MSHIFAVPVLLASAGVMAADGSGAPQPPPIRLVAESTGSSIQLKVIGDASGPVQAFYSLEVSSSSSGGRNTSIQKGRARLDAGKEVILAALNLGNVRGGEWEAVLQVTPEGAPGYQERLGSDIRKR